MKLLIVSTQKSLYHAMRKSSKTYMVSYILRLRRLKNSVHHKIMKLWIEKGVAIMYTNINEQQYKENTVNVKRLLNEIMNQMNLNYTSKFTQSRFLIDRKF